ncbi:hypothetical protein pCXcHC2016_11 [Xenohaliotis phage pCXc-HC2016]|nr:hypothetical protein pCXcHC2016_11 [Xenohaliotis phage pCXc-HC2016]AQW89118.1 hypothetical protein pCXcHR2015_11 [Xenohaliotis phage pCXc-HR2015]
MTVSATATVFTILDGNGNDTFTFPFKAFVEKTTPSMQSIVVWERAADGTDSLQIQGSDYVVLNIQAETGQIKFSTKTIPTGNKVVIASDVPYGQKVNFPDNAAIVPSQLQLAVDRIAQQLKQLAFLDGLKVGLEFPPEIDSLKLFVDPNITADAPVFFSQDQNDPNKYLLKAGDFTIAELKTLRDEIDAAKTAAESAKVAAEQSATNAASSAQTAANAAAQTATNAAQVAQSLIDISKIVADGKADITKLVTDGTTSLNQIVTTGTTSLNKLVTDGTTSLNQIVTDATLVIDNKVVEAENAATDAQTAAGVAKTEADRAEAAAVSLPDYTVGSAGDVFITDGDGNPPVRQKYISGTDFSKLALGEFFTADGSGGAEKSSFVPIRNEDIAQTDSVVKFFNDSSGKYLLATSFGAVSSKDVLSVNSANEGGLDQRQINELFKTRLNALAPVGEAYPWGMSNTIADFIVNQDGYLISTTDSFIVLPNATKTPNVSNEIVGNRNQYTTDGNYSIPSHINGKDFFLNDFSALLCLFIDSNISSGDATIVANTQFNISKIGTDIVYTVGADSWTIPYTANNWVCYLLASDGIGTVSNISGEYIGGVLKITDNGDQTITKNATSEDFELTLEPGIRMSRLVMVDKRVVQSDLEKFLKFIFNIPDSASGMLPPAVSTNGYGIVTDASQYTQKPVIYSKSFPNDWTIDWAVDTSSPGLLDKKAVVFKADVPNKTLTVEAGDSGSGTENFPSIFITNPPSGATYVSNIDGTAMDDGKKFNLTVTKNGTVFTFDIEDSMPTKTNTVVRNTLATISSATPVKIADADDATLVRNVFVISDEDDVGGIYVGQLADLTADRTKGSPVYTGTSIALQQNRDYYAISISDAADFKGKVNVVDEVVV